MKGGKNKMEWKHVGGENRGDIALYALSTCVWCKKTKGLLDDLGVAYRYIYVDLLAGEDRDEVLKEVDRWNSRRSFPTVVIGNRECIVGYEPDRIKEVLGL